MAWNREVELKINLLEGGGQVIISDLHIDFDIERSRSSSENTAEFIIYNAKEDTRKKILRNGNGIIFSAGYEDEGKGVLFTGNIFESSSVRVGADWITTIEAVAARNENTPYEAVLVSLSYKAKSEVTPLLQEIALAANLSLFGAANIETLSLDNGFVYSGSVRGALAQILPILQAEGKALYVDNSEIIVYNIGEQSSFFTAALLTYENGLKSVKDITEQTKDQTQPKKKIEFNSIIIPTLQPNSVITIKDTKENGTFIVDKLKIFGNNYGGDFDITGEATE